jgi:hypothetical protein
MTVRSRFTELWMHLNLFAPRYNYGASERLGWVCCGIDLPDYNTVMIRIARIRR